MMFSLHNIWPDQVPFSKMPFLLHEVTVDIKEAKNAICSAFLCTHKDLEVFSLTPFMHKTVKNPKI